MGKLWIEKNESDPEVIHSHDDLSSTHDDKSSDPVSWNDYGLQAMDYHVCREHIKELCIIAANPNYPTIDFSGWAGLSQAHRDVYIKWVVCPYVLRVPAITDEQDAANWREIVINTEGRPYELLKGRAKIAEDMRLAITDYVRKEFWVAGDYEANLSKAQEMDRATWDKLLWYEKSRAQDFRQWLTNEVGSPYENDGFAELSAYHDDIKNDLLDIYNVD